MKEKLMELEGESGNFRITVEDFKTFFLSNEYCEQTENQ